MTGTGSRQRARCTSKKELVRDQRSGEDYRPFFSVGGPGPPVEPGKRNSANTFGCHRTDRQRLAGVMKTVNSKGFALSLFSLAVPPDLSHPCREWRAKGPGKTVGQSTVIKSDSLEIDNQKRLVTFTGNVDVRADDLIITCEKMFLHYTGSVPKDLFREKQYANGKNHCQGEGENHPSGRGSRHRDEAVYSQKDGTIVDPDAPGKAGRGFCGGVQDNPFFE